MPCPGAGAAVLAPPSTGCPAQPPPATSGLRQPAPVPGAWRPWQPLVAGDGCARRPRLAAVASWRRQLPQLLAWHHAGGWPGHPAWRVPRPSGRTAGPARAAGGASCPAHGRLPVPQACPPGAACGTAPAVRASPRWAAPPTEAGGCPASCHEAGSPATAIAGHRARPPAPAPRPAMAVAAASASGRVASQPHLPAPRASAAGPPALAAGPVRGEDQLPPVTHPAPGYRPATQVLASGPARPEGWAGHHSQARPPQQAGGRPLWVGQGTCGRGTAPGPSTTGPACQAPVPGAWAAWPVGVLGTQVAVLVAGWLVAPPVVPGLPRAWGPGRPAGTTGGGPRAYPGHGPRGYGAPRGRLQPLHSRRAGDGLPGPGTGAGSRAASYCGSGRTARRASRRVARQPRAWPGRRPVPARRLPWPRRAGW